MAQNKDIFKIQHNDIVPDKGKILISEPFLQDLYFQRSVVLLVNHGEQGSMGFVVNKKTNFFVNDFFDELKDFPEIPIFLGGPVLSNHLFFIHSLGDKIPDSVQINDDLFFDGDFESLMLYILSGQPYQEKLKFFIGYSGWVDNQLETEINQDSWLVSNASNRNIILAQGESFWKLSVEDVGGSYLTWINYPKDPILN
jgi:putative transcriptional regulator